MCSTDFTVCCPDGLACVEGGLCATDDFVTCYKNEEPCGMFPLGVDEPEDVG